jgi:hypothetical protein
VRELGIMNSPCIARCELEGGLSSAMKLDKSGGLFGDVRFCILGFRFAVH